MVIDCDDLLIDTRDERVVLAKLLDLPGLGSSAIDRSPQLGLTKVTLTGVRTAIARLRADADHGPRATAAMVAQFGVPDTSVDIDVLIALVREWARATFPEWRPVVERDHDDGPVETNPHTKISIGPPIELTPSSEARVPPGDPVGPRVGIADAQLYAHDDLAGRYLGQPLTGHGPFPTGSAGHATFVAGTVLCRSPSALLICRQVLVPGQPNRSWDVANRLMDSLEDDLDVLNMSFGCKGEAGEPLPMRRAVERLGKRTVLVAAVGNHAVEEGNRPLYPAAFGNVIAVGAAEAMRRSGAEPSEDELADSTPDVPWLDLVAPGLNQIGPYLVGEVAADSETVASHPQRFSSGYVRWSGSSFAAAAASGEIAQLMVERGIDAGAARDVLLQNGVGNVQPFAYDLTTQGLLS